MSKPIRLVLLYGGKSGEHEISLVSAASILANLDANRYEIIPVGMDKEGRCFLNDYHALRAFSKALPVKTEASKPLESLIVNGRFAIQTDVVFPIVHGPLYEDGCLQGILELAGIAYVGCGVLSSALGMDKDIARRLVCTEDIKTTAYRRFTWAGRMDLLEAFCHETVAAMEWPLFVKPCSMGSSVGIHKVSTMEALVAAISDARRYDEEVLVEAFVAGREIELAVLENANPTAPPRVSVPGEIKVNHPDGFYSYSAKYLESQKTELDVPAILDADITARLQQMAATIFTQLKCRGMARVDFFVDDQRGAIYFNEINTIPGFTPISMYPKMWQASGLSYVELLDELIELAMMRRSNRDQLVASYQ